MLEVAGVFFDGAISYAQCTITSMYFFLLWWDFPSFGVGHPVTCLDNYRGIPISQLAWISAHKYG